jgi:hypothetical protein
VEHRAVRDRGPGSRNLALPKENFLIRTAALVLLIAFGASAEPKIDNVLVKMVPPGTTSIVGARMDVLKATDFYKRMLAAQKLPQLDKFAVESGFDPRRDVKEILFAEAPQGSVLLGRGTFRINEPILQGAKKIRYHEYTIVAQEASGFCILDSTLAVAGEIPAIEAALDEWKSGKHTAALPLIAKVKAASESTQLWGVSTGAAAFLADNLPIMSGGIDFSKIFRGLEDTWFVGDFSAGLRADVHGTAAKEQDAANLRDAVKGLVGLGRLSVPEKQPELLKLWDGITVEQMGRAITVHADIPQDLMERVVRLLSASRTGGKI